MDEITELKETVTKELQEIESNCMIESNCTRDTSDVGVTRSSEEWRESLNENSVLQDGEIVFDDEVIRNTKVFMLTPVVGVKGEILVATTRMFDSLEEVRNFVKENDFALRSLETIQCQRSENGSIVSKIKYLLRGVVL